MQKFTSCLIVIFGFLLTKDVLCTKHEIYSRADNGADIFPSPIGDGKIIGGKEIDIKEVPYQAKLTMIREDGRAYGCGGSIIGQQYILTAAHCITGAKTVYVRVGSNYKDKEGVLHTSTEFWTHPNWNNKTLDNDAGIVRINTPIVYNQNTKPIRMASRGKKIPGGTEVLVTGWGYTSANGPQSDKIMAIRVPVVTNEDCRQNYTYIADNMLCAGVREGGKSVCFGDSGGPARSKYGLIGIVSFVSSSSCDRPGYPGGFARVPYPGIRDWIKQVTGI